MAIGCKGEAPPSPAQDTPVPGAQAVEPNEPAPAQVDSRTQYDLEKDIQGGERAGGADERAAAFEAIRKSWLGKRVRWSVYYLPVFCPDHERCNVVPFDRGGRDKKVVQGWTPKLHLQESEWQKLSASCPDASQRCRATFEGSLSTFTLSTEALTQLAFSDVKIVEAEPVAEDVPPVE